MRKFLVFSFAVLLGLQIGPHAFAHSVSEDDLRELMHDAHEALENETDEQTFVEKLREKTKFKTFFLNAYRWHQSHQDQAHVANAAANIVLLLTTSHLIETVGGVSMASLGVAHGLDSTADKVMTVIGMIIPIPGLDPMCLLLVGSYGKWPKGFDRALTIPRRILLNTASKTNQMLGLPEGWIKTALSSLRKSKFLQAYVQGGDRYSYQHIFDNMAFTIFGSQPGQEINLFMKRGADGRLYLAKLTWSEKAPAIHKYYLADLLKPFGSNIKSLVMEIDEAFHQGRPENLTKMDYIENFVRNEDGSTTIQVRQGAFPFFNLRAQDFSCEEFLSARRANR